MSPSGSADRYPLRSRSTSHSARSKDSGTVGSKSRSSDTHTNSPKHRTQLRERGNMKEKYEAKHRAQLSPDEKTDREFPTRSKATSFDSSILPSFVHYEEPFTVELHPFQEPLKAAAGMYELLGHECEFNSIPTIRASMKLFVQYLTTAWQLYLLQLDRWPVITKSVTAAVIGVMADVLAQTITYAQQPTTAKCTGWFDCLDMLSLRNQFLIRLAFSPPQHYWYEFLGRLFRRYEIPEPTKGHETAINFEWNQSVEAHPVVARRQPMWVVVAKMVLDQLTFGPLSNLLYFYAIGFMEGRSLAFIESRIAHDYVNLMIANYKVWPAIILFNFRYVPPQLQVLFGNIVAIFWNTYVVLTTRM